MVTIHIYIFPRKTLQFLYYIRSMRFEDIFMNKRFPAKNIALFSFLITYFSWFSRFRYAKHKRLVCWEFLFISPSTCFYFFFTNIVIIITIFYHVSYYVTMILVAFSLVIVRFVSPNDYKNFVMIFLSLSFQRCLTRRKRRWKFERDLKVLRWLKN